MSLTPLEKELLGYVKALSEACEQSVSISQAHIQLLNGSLELLLTSQRELLSALIEFVSEEMNYEKLMTNLSKAGQQLIIAEKKLNELQSD